jgi:hypothetical protein
VIHVAGTPFGDFPAGHERLAHYINAYTPCRCTTCSIPASPRPMPVGARCGSFGAHVLDKGIRACHTARNT